MGSNPTPRTVLLGFCVKTAFGIYHRVKTEPNKDLTEPVVASFMRFHNLLLSTRQLILSGVGDRRFLEWPKHKAPSHCYSHGRDIIRRIIPCGAVGYGEHGKERPAAKTEGRPTAHSESLARQVSSDQVNGVFRLQNLAGSGSAVRQPKRQARWNFSRIP